MALRTEAYYRTIATEALERVGCSEPPVPIDDIASALGIPVRIVNLPHFFTAATVSEDGLPAMIVNWAKTEQERRDALAHMLGHVLLVAKGDGTTYPRSDPDHSDAEMVARELVLPTAMVVDQGRLWFNDYRYLARLFAVDEQRMLGRMREMGLLKGPDGMAWDF